MKNLFKQKSLKVCAISIVVSGMALVGYNAYSNATMTPEERLFQQNLDALTSGEGSITTWKCSNVGSDVCRHYCGICHTEVIETGRASGSHTCW